MILAIEYAIRSRIIEDCLETPCSLFLQSRNSKDKVVITIEWHEFSKKYLAKQWTLKKNRNQELLPPFLEVSLDREELFTSDEVVMPGCDLLEFYPPLYRPKKQRSHGPEAERQEESYQRYHDNFWNPFSNKNNRLRWLWDAFTKAHGLYLDHLYHSFQMQITFVQLHMRHRYGLSWGKWLKYMKPETEVASELVFHNAFRTHHKIIVNPKPVIPNFGSVWASAYANASNNDVIATPNELWMTGL